MQPTRPCPQPRCPELQPCPRHERKPFATARRTGVSLYRTAEWRRESKAFLAANPSCVETVTSAHPPNVDGGVALGLMVASCGNSATVVDHRIPHRGNEGAFWERGNWQALCRRCHQAKTGREARVRAYG